jgi:hypothetical protein
MIHNTKANQTAFKFKTEETKFWLRKLSFSFVDLEIVEACCGHTNCSNFNSEKVSHEIFV